MTIDIHNTTETRGGVSNMELGHELVAVKNHIRQLNLQSNYPSLHNKRIILTPRPDIGRVVIKIVEKNTDKVIKELPPVALQHMYRHIRLLIEQTA